MSTATETTAVECPEPGIYENIPFDEYRQWKAVNCSTLLSGRITMAHLEAAIDGRLKRPESKDLNFGRALHARCLEPEVYKSQFSTTRRCAAILKSGNNKGTQCRHMGNATEDLEHWYCGQHAPASMPIPDNCITPDEAERIEKIADSLRRKRVMHAIRRTGGFEASCVWDHEIRTPLGTTTTVRCKCRKDKMITEIGVPPTIVDLKKVQSGAGGRDAFAQSINKYNYHIRAAAYVECYEALLGQTPTFIWVVCEDDEPFEVATYYCGPETLKLGRYLFNNLLMNYAGCLDRGEWPGYGEEIEEIGVPQRILNQHQELLNEHD